MFFDELYISALRRRGIENARELAALANQVMELFNQRRLDEARALIDGIEEPLVRQDLEDLYKFESSSRCIRSS
jgi:hypothetical protein